MLAKPFGSGGSEIVDCGAKLAKDHRIAWSAGECFLSEIHEPNRTEAPGDALEARCGELPIGVAARAPHEIELSGGTLDKCFAKLPHQHAVVPDGGGERGVEGSWIVYHGRHLTDCR